MSINLDAASDTSWFFPRLHASLRQWTRAAGSAMARYAEANSLPPNVFDGIGKQANQAFLVAEWGRVQDEVRNDPKLSAQVGQPVGTVLWTMALGADDLGYQFINAMLHDPEHRNGAGYDMPADYFDELYAPIDSFLGSPTIEYTATAIILGLQCEAVPIQFSDSVRLDLVDVEMEVPGLTSSLIDVAYEQISRGIGVFDIPTHYRHAIIRRFALPKASYDEAAAAKVYEEIEADRQNALSAIAACTPCYVLPWRGVVSECGWRVRRSSVKLGGPQIIWRLEAPGAVVRREHEPILIRAWEHLSDPAFRRNNSNISIALSRLAWLGTRLSHEDRLVDAMIAAEAFFISKSDGEIAYRLATNAAMLGKRVRPDLSPRLIYDFMKAAYTIRSKIVHGDVPKHYRFKNNEIGVSRFLSDTIELVRASIAWALHEFEPGTKIAIDWEEMTFEAGAVTRN